MLSVENVWQTSKTWVSGSLNHALVYRKMYICLGCCTVPVALFPSKLAGPVSYLKFHSHVNHIAIVKKQANKKKNKLAKYFLSASLRSSRRETPNVSKLKQQAWTGVTSLC